MKPVGHEGQPIPLPPELTLSWRNQLSTFVQWSLGIAAAILIPGLVSFISILGEVSWEEGLRRFGMAVGIALGGGILASTLVILISLAFWPWTKKHLGAKLESQVGGLTAEELQAEIERARAAVQSAAPKDQAEREEWLRWLETRKPMQPQAAHLREAGPENWTLKPALGPQIMMACIGAPFLALAVWVAIDAVIQREITLTTAGSIVVVAALGAWCIGEISTARIHLTEDRLLLRRFWHTRWSVAREQAELREGFVSDANLPGYRVFDRGSGKQVGAIIGSQFRSDDLGKLAALLPPRG